MNALEAPDLLERPAPPEPIARRTRPFAWSLRRELWENRSVTWGPVAVAGLVLLGSLVPVARSASHFRETLDAVERHARVTLPFGMAPAPIMLACFLIGLFYALDALHGERRDRSYLFWKSLPVSDRTTVLAKAVVPMAVLPSIALLLSLTVFVLLLLFGTLVFAARGVGPALLWREVHWLQEPVIMAYGLAVHALWFAPIYAWLLLVSAWARRLPLLWAVLPPFALVALERVVADSARFGHWLGWRVTGAMQRAFAVDPGHLEGIDQLSPGRFLATPGLWGGLVLAALCLVAATRLRRRREPS